MNLVTRQQFERQANASQATRSQLANLIERAVCINGAGELIKGLTFNRASSTTKPLHSVFEPSFCVIAQGSKAIFLGNERYVYDPDHYFLVTANLPVTGQILEATKERPYLGLRLKLDPAVVGLVLAEVGNSTMQHQGKVRAATINVLDEDLLDAVVRLIKLLDKPAEVPFLAPLCIREIIFRLLQGEQGERLRYVIAHSSYTPHIAKAIEHLRNNFDQTIHIEELARELGMSVSGFHQQFKAVTAFSPLQYLKRIRLQEARRLMLGEGLDASSAAYRVGYKDASHFNREYKGFFGLPPIHDVERLREVTLQQASVGAN